MPEIKNGGLDQYGAEPFKQQQSGTAGVQRVKVKQRVGRESLTGAETSTANNLTLTVIAFDDIYELHPISFDSGAIVVTLAM